MVSIKCSVATTSAGAYAATACSKCPKKEISVTKCRVEYKHHTTNGIKAVPMTNVTGDGYSKELARAKQLAYASLN